MIREDDLRQIGKFHRTHALKGELNVALDIPSDYAQEGNPLIVDIDGIYVPFYAESIRPKGQDSYLVKLEDVDSESVASQMVNKIIYGRKDILEDYIDEEDGWDSLEVFVGYHVIDSRLGDIGEVTGFDESTVNELLIVKYKAGKEIMIPFAEAFIKEIDDENNVIITTLPDELFELN